MPSGAPPRYQQIADELRQNIEKSVYQVGDQLPTEAELSRRFDVNRHTLRRAIEVLRNEGLLRVDRGRGTFVSAIPITYAIGKRVRYNEMLKAQGFIPTYRQIRLLELPADGSVAKHLAVSVGDPVVLFERLSLVDDSPLSLASSYFPKERMPDIAIQCEAYCSISKMIQDCYGFDHIRQSTRISARMVQSRDANYLQVALSSPILLTESVNVNQMGNVIEYGVSRFRCDRMELVFDHR